MASYLLIRHKVRGGPTQLDSFSGFLSDGPAIRQPRQAVAG